MASQRKRKSKEGKERVPSQEVRLAARGRSEVKEGIRKKKRDPGSFVGQVGEGPEK